jgi:pyridoxal phosphate enzyme (YggS family)
MTEVAAKLAEIRARMAVACKKAERQDVPRLIAVSKKQPLQKIEEAIAAGQRLFGENYVQEAATKFVALRSNAPDLELHLIGPLQTNKAEEAVKIFDAIQTLDRPKLAKALQAASRKSGRSPLLYIEVNIGREPQKAGILPEDARDFLRFCEEDCGLKISGFMCIPPADKTPLPYFRTMQELTREFRLPRLSMGMTADFEEAILSGATEVRVGTGLFGERPPQPD